MQCGNPDSIAVFIVSGQKFRKLGGHLGFKIEPESPIMQAQSLINGYFGTLGLYFLQASDMLIPSTGERPEMRLDQYPVVKRFLREQPYRGTSYETDFYNLLSETQTTVATVRKMLSEGRDPNLTEDEKQKYAFGKTMERISDIASKINAQMRAIQRDPKMSAAEKRRQIDELNKQQADLFSQLAKQLPEDFALKHGMTR